MVGASGFEPPASWSRTKNPRNISNLAALPMSARHCAKLLVCKDFQAFSTTALATLRNASMHGVGTKMGTVFFSRFWCHRANEYWDFRPTWHLQNPARSFKWR